MQRHIVGRANEQVRSQIKDTTIRKRSYNFSAFKRNRRFASFTVSLSSGWGLQPNLFSAARPEQSPTRTNMPLLQPAARCS